MGNRERRLEEARESARVRLDKEDLKYKDYFPFAYEVWQELKTMPHSYGIQMVVDVLQVAERLEKENNEDR